MFSGIIKKIFLKSDIMAGPNSGGNTGEGFEANENTAPKQENMYSKLVKSYVSKKLNSKKERLAFAKKIKSGNSIPDEVISELEAHKGSSSEFAGLEVKKENISISTLQRELGSFLVGIESQKNSLRSTFLQEYDIEPSEYTQNIAGKIDAISSEEELQKLQGSDILRDEFLAKNYKKKSPKRRLVSHILQDMNIEEKYDNLESHLKVAFMSTVSKMQRREKLEISDIMPLFESEILEIDEKQKIIETFMPSMSVEDALKLGVINANGVKSIKKQALEKALDTGWLRLTNLDNYLSEINDSELIISTQGLFKSQGSQEKLFEQNFFFEKFQHDFDAMLQKIEKDLADQSIQTVGEMQEILSDISHISGIENFKSGSTLVIKQQQKTSGEETEEVTLYAEIKSLASAGRFIIEEKGVDVYDQQESKSSRQTYSQFIDYLTKGDIPSRVDILTPEKLKHKIQSGEIQDKNGNGNFEDKTQVTQDIKDITGQIEERKKELQKQGVAKNKWEEDPKLLELKKIRDEKNEILNNVDEKNIKSLLGSIDEIDSDGKEYGLEAGTSFVTKDGKGEVYTVQSFDEVNQRIVIRGLEEDESISYVQFIEHFEKTESKRVSKIKTFEDLFSQGDDAYKQWGGFSFKDGKIKNDASKLKIDYNYLVPPAGGESELIKIHNIDGGRVTISFGEVKDQKKFDKKKGKDEKIGEIFSTEKQEYTVDVGVLDHYIRKNKLEIRSLDEGKVKEEEINGIPKPDTKFGIGNWFFQGLSISAAIKGGKTAIEQIGQMWSEGDDVKANEFAFKMFGPLLGKDGQTEFRTRIEETQKKNMDEFISKLEGINSHPATVLIDSWMKDPRAPQYKKEAAMFFMFKKYGALCAKEMYKYQGKYFWYQQMGGKIGDKVWVETHAKNDREPKQNTTEEQLVYNLMAEQVKDTGFNGIKRRSKLAKELKAMRGIGKSEEYETGQKDGSNERDLQDRLDGGLSELSSGNYPNAFGWLDTIVGKGGSMKDMNMIPFVTVFSGMAYNFEKDILDKIKNFPGESKMLMMLRMMSYKGDIKLLNDTIMEICTRLDGRGYPGILSEAQVIFDNQSDKSISEKKKQEATIKFYKKYGEVLTSTLYMLNTGKEEDIHNKMIFFEKDSCSTFKTYYDKIQGYVNADGDFGKDEGLMADAFAGAGTSGIDIYRATKQVLELKTAGAWAKHESGPIMWKEIMHEFEAIPRRKYNSDPVVNEQMQRKLLDSNLRKFLKAILSLNTDTKATSSYNSPVGYFSRLNDWGVYFDDIINAGASAEDIGNGEHKKLIDGFIDGIINYSRGGASRKKPYKLNKDGRYEYIEPGEQTNTLSVSDLIQGKTQQIIGNPGSPVNDNRSPE